MKTVCLLNALILQKTDKNIQIDERKTKNKQVFTAKSSRNDDYLLYSVTPQIGLGCHDT